MFVLAISSVAVTTAAQPCLMEAPLGSQGCALSCPDPVPAWGFRGDQRVFTAHGFSMGSSSGSLSVEFNLLFLPG